MLAIPEVHPPPDPLSLTPFGDLLVKGTSPSPTPPGRRTSESGQLSTQGAQAGQPGEPGKSPILGRLAGTRVPCRMTLGRKRVPPSLPRPELVRCASIVQHGPSLQGPSCPSPPPRCPWTPPRTHRCPHVHVHPDRCVCPHGSRTHTCMHSALVPRLPVLQAAASPVCRLPPLAAFPQPAQRNLGLPPPW